MWAAREAIPLTFCVSEGHERIPTLIKVGSCIVDMVVVVKIPYSSSRKGLLVLFHEAWWGLTV